MHSKNYIMLGRKTVY